MVHLSVVMLFLLSAGLLQAQTVSIDGNPFEWGQSQITSIPTHQHVLDAYGSGVVDDQFTEGSKDFMEAGNTAAQHLVWAYGQTKAKNDIENAAAVVIENPIIVNQETGLPEQRTGRFLFFAGDRRSTNGDAQIGFWFYVDGTSPVMVDGNGYFDPEHGIGDLLVLSDFTNGGTNPTVTVYKWVGFGNGDSGPDLQLELVNVNADIAINNKTEFPIPIGWEYEGVENDCTEPTNPIELAEYEQCLIDKSIPYYELLAFYEGVVDVSTVLSGVDICDASWLLETRSSQELTASLDDFAGGQFNLTPTANVTGEDLVCNAEFTILYGSSTPEFGEQGIVYVWYKKGGEGEDDVIVQDGNEEGQNSATYQAQEPGTYYLIVYNQGCPVLEPAEITINEAPFETLVANCPGEVLIDCTQDIATAFTNWKAANSYTYTGGVGVINGTITYHNSADGTGDDVGIDGLLAPNYCDGGVVSIKYVISDECEQIDQCVTKFTVDADDNPPVLTGMLPSDVEDINDCKPMAIADAPTEGEI
ncbi:hypothetical protein, partial [Seonamhaeicola aphaedonensis]|uniref:hypothetical protein n=1 Tax=Seonamhaeicola aphaedonensis TaxID=1461338 RepID=UPI001C6E55F7